MRRRRSVLWFLAGLIAVIGAAETAASVLGPRGTGHATIHHHQVHLARADTTEPVPLVFLGDSSTGAAFDGSIFQSHTGSSGYALWLPDASPSILAPLLTEFFTAEAAAEHVVIGVTARMFNATTETIRLDRLAAARASLAWRSRVNPTTLTRLETRIADNSALIRYRAGLRRPTDWLNAIGTNDHLTLTADGQMTYFLDKNVSNIRAGYEPGERSALAHYRVSETEVEVLFDLVEELRHDQISVGLVLLPTYDPVYDRFFDDPEADDRFRDQLSTEAAARGIPVIDLTGLADRAELFADGNHLNRTGARVATELLTEHLTRS